MFEVGCTFGKMCQPLIEWFTEIVKMDLLKRKGLPEAVHAGDVAVTAVKNNNWIGQGLSASQTRNLSQV